MQFRDLLEMTWKELSEWREAPFPFSREPTELTMAEIKTGVLLTLRDQYSAAMGKAGQATTNFSKGAVGELNKIEGAFSGLGAKLAGVERGSRSGHS
jgi:hypothetical protein